MGVHAVHTMSPETFSYSPVALHLIVSGMLPVLMPWSFLQSDSPLTAGSIGSRGSEMPAVLIVAKNVGILFAQVIFRIH